MPHNLFVLPDLLPGGEELNEPLLQAAGVRIERIVSWGQQTPPGQWYDQAEGEWVALLQGQATLAYADGSEMEMHAGDHVWIPAHCRHRVAYTSHDPPCIWLAVHVEGT